MAAKLILSSVLIMLGISISGAPSFLWPIAQTIPPAEFKAGIERMNSTLIDVRTYEEFSQEHILGAINIDITKPDFIQLADSLFNKMYPCYVYCKAGVRSAKAMEMMQENGFIEIYNLKGGIEQWKREGYPVVKSPMLIAKPQ